MDFDAMTGVERPRNRFLWAVVAVLVPIIVIGGGAAFFIHTTIAPIFPRMSGVTLFASNDTGLATSEPASGPASQPAAPAPSMFSGLESTSLWPGVPLTQPLATQPSAPTYASAEPIFNSPGGTSDAREPIAGPIPMPPPRPRISNAAPRSNAPRPQRDANEQD